jgi:predicted DNA binding CopG/RHH family protein
MKKKIPVLKTDDEAGRFVDTADLSEYDLSGFKRVHFEFQKKTAQLNMRVPKPLLDAVKKRAKARGIPYTRFVREAVEHALSRPSGRERK